MLWPVVRVVVVEFVENIEGGFEGALCRVIFHSGLFFCL